MPPRDPSAVPTRRYPPRALHHTATLPLPPPPSHTCDPGPLPLSPEPPDPPWHLLSTSWCPSAPVSSLWLDDSTCALASGPRLVVPLVRGGGGRYLPASQPGLRPAVSRTRRRGTLASPPGAPLLGPARNRSPPPGLCSCSHHLQRLFTGSSSIGVSRRRGDLCISSPSPLQPVVAGMPSASASCSRTVKMSENWSVVVVVFQWV